MYRNKAIEYLSEISDQNLDNDILEVFKIAIEDMKITELCTKDIFENLERIEYTNKNGYKEIFSHYGHPAEYYERHYDREVTGRQYASMLRFKDNTIKCYDLRWKHAESVIDLMANEIGLDIETVGSLLYHLDSKDESLVVNAMRKYCDNSGDKVKLKKQIKELEKQVELLTGILKGAK